MTIRLNGATSGYTEIDAPAVAGSNTLVLPTGNGSSGQVLSTNGSGALSWANGATTGPAFSAYNNAAQSVSNSIETKVIFNTEEFDTASAFDSSTNYRFTPTIAGYYQLNAIIRAIGSASLTTAYLSFFKNGSVFIRGTEFSGGITSGAAIQIQANHLLYLNGTTDYIEVYALLAGSTGTWQLGYAGTPFTSRFSGFLARPA
jgi:hypothetical protein